LIRGNHDRPFTDEQFAPYFEQVIPEGEGVDVEIGGVPCYITHYPSLAKEDRYNLVGHIHAAWKVQLNSLNVGVDVNHFFPVDEKQIPFFLNAVTNFYDLDVWTAYNPANQGHFVNRGKKSNYFVPKEKANV
jgi:calcineurin-like phosphoesterase family protein